MRESKADGVFDSELMEDMKVEVENWIWSGYMNAVEIDAEIEQEAVSGAAIDVEDLKAHARQVLAHKREVEQEWPETTDCDRLDSAFARLREQNICALQCAGNTLREGFEAVTDHLDSDDERADSYVGFCFFHSQDVARALEGEGLMLAFGAIDSDDDADYVAAGRVVCSALEENGLAVEWSGSPQRRIGVKIRWQRRTPE
jgi:hypothetical protein